MTKNWNISSHVMLCGNRSLCPWWVRSDGTLSVSDSSWIDQQICFSSSEQNLHWMSSSALWRTHCRLMFIHSPETKREMFIFPSRSFSSPLTTRSAAPSSLNLGLRIHPVVQTEAAESSVELWRLVYRDDSWREHTSVCSGAAAGFRWRGVFSD